MISSEVVPSGYRVVELDERVPNINPLLVTRFRWRADRRMHQMNTQRILPLYRYEMCRWTKDRWAVVAMQNQLQRDV